MKCHRSLVRFQLLRYPFVFVHADACADLRLETEFGKQCTRKIGIPFDFFPEFLYISHQFTRWTPVLHAFAKSLGKTLLPLVVGWGESSIMKYLLRFLHVCFDFLTQLLTHGHTLTGWHLFLYHFQQSCSRGQWLSRMRVTH